MCYSHGRGGLVAPLDAAMLAECYVGPSVNQGLVGVVVVRQQALLELALVMEDSLERTKRRNHGGFNGPKRGFESPLSVCFFFFSSSAAKHQNKQAKFRFGAEAEQFNNTVYLSRFSERPNNVLYSEQKLNYRVFHKPSKCDFHTQSAVSHHLKYCCGRNKSIKTHEPHRRM